MPKITPITRPTITTKQTTTIATMVPAESPKKQKLNNYQSKSILNKLPSTELPGIVDDAVFVLLIWSGPTVVVNAGGVA